jgi:uncharacterized protein (TIGR02246 family)
MCTCTRLPLLLVLAALIPACRTPRDTAERSATGSESAAHVDKAAEEQKIRGLEQRWRQALSTKDSAAIGAFYAEDGFYLPQGSDGYQGPEKIRARWTMEFIGGKFELQREPTKIDVADAGDMAYEVGRYKVSWDKPSKHQKGQGSGNYVTVWVKHNGEWKTAAYIWNRGEQP